jgi:outer membrane biosynthesis protein TonB
MIKKLLAVLILIGLGTGYYYYNNTTPVTPPQQIVQPVIDPTEPPKYEFKLPEPKPNEQTAPKEELKAEIIVQPKKDKAPIRYDKNVERPSGYYDYCDKYPNRPECGAKK